MYREVNTTVACNHILSKEFVCIHAVYFNLSTGQRNNPVWKVTHLKKGKVLILIDLNSKHRVAVCLRKSNKSHLSIKELCHWFLKKATESGFYCIHMATCFIQSGVRWLAVESNVRNVMIIIGFISFSGALYGQALIYNGAKLLKLEDGPSEAQPSYFSVHKETMKCIFS